MVTRAQLQELIGQLTARATQARGAARLASGDERTWQTRDADLLERAIAALAAPPQAPPEPQAWCETFTPMTHFGQPTGDDACNDCGLPAARHPVPSQGYERGYLDACADHIARVDAGRSNVTQGSAGEEPQATQITRPFVFESFVYEVDAAVAPPQVMPTIEKGDVVQIEDGPLIRITLPPWPDVPREAWPITAIYKPVVTRLDKFARRA